MMTKIVMAVLVVITGVYLVVGPAPRESLFLLIPLSWALYFVARNLFKEKEKDTDEQEKREKGQKRGRRE